MSEDISYPCLSDGTCLNDSLIAELRSEVKRLTDDRDAAIDELTTRRENFEVMSHRLIASGNENAKLRAALELFADHDNYDIGGDWKREGLHPIDIASNALGKVKP